MADILEHFSRFVKWLRPLGGLKPSSYCVVREKNLNFTNRTCLFIKHYKSVVKENILKLILW